MEGRQVITEVDAEGCPSALEDASTKFVNQCVVIVRARIPITTRLWKTTKPKEQQHAVPAHKKEMLWAELKDMFTLSEGVDQEMCLEKDGPCLCNFQEEVVHQLH